MNSPKKIAFGFVCSITLIVVGAAFSVSSNMAGPLRNFEFTYLTRIPTLPAGSKISRIWIPLPHSDPYQTVNDLKIESPFPYAKHRDPEYGNEYLYLQVPAGKLATAAEVRISFHATRQEHRVELDARPASAPSAGADLSGLQRFLKPDRRVPLDGIIAELSVQASRGIQDPLESASNLQLRHRHDALRQVRHRLGERRCDMGLHGQARQLY
jgi:hypothetical protein